QDWQATPARTCGLCGKWGNSGTLKIRTHGIDSPRGAYSWILAISVLSWAPITLWQPRHRSTDGSPAYSERRASAWQYWQSIWNEPAWIRWLKRIGWRGAPAPGHSTLGRGR